MVTINAEDPEEEIVAKMCYNVGYALTCWGHVEERLGLLYAAMVVPKGGRSEAAITTFREIKTLDQRIGLIKKVVDQVFYSDELSEFREGTQKRLNRIRTLNEVRNKIAHGRCLWGGFGGASGPRFGPYYIEAVHMRSDFMLATKVATSRVQTQEVWTLEDLERNAFSLREGMALADELLDSFDELLNTKEDAVTRGGWIILERGMPTAGVGARD